MADEIPKLTKKAVRALSIIHEVGSVSPAQFARLYFDKDHEGWRRTAKCGNNGVTKGGGLVLWAGGYIGRLREKKLVTHVYGSSYPVEHRLTELGVKALKHHQK